jgi:glycerol transport system permease protein
VSGNTAVVAGHTIELDRGYPALGNGARIEIGVRPEFVEIAGEGEGLPVTSSGSTISAASRSSRCNSATHVFNVIAEEGTAGAADGARIRFDKPASMSTPTAASSPQAIGGQGGLMDKTWNNKAWFLVLPVLALVAFNAIIPLMTVVNYSVQETFGGNVFFFEGVKWFEQVLRSERFHAALGRQLTFTGTILLIEIPLGVAIALTMPRKGPMGLGVPGADGAAAADPVERGRRHLEHLRAAEIGLLGRTQRARLRLQLYPQPVRRLVHPDPDGRLALDLAGGAAGLCRADRSPTPITRPRASTGPRAGRVPLHPAAQDEAVLTIAILLRFMDSFMIYTEPFVLTGGGPGQRHHAAVDRSGEDGARPVRPRPGRGDVDHLFPHRAAAQLDLLHRHDGPGEPLMTLARPTVNRRCQAPPPTRARAPVRLQARLAGADALHHLPDGADLLAAEHVVQDTNEILGAFTLWPRTLHARQLPRDPHRSDWYSGYINSIIYVTMNTVISVTVALPAAYAFSRYRFLGDKHLFFWLLTNRMAPPAIFALPFFQLYSSVGLFDTHLAVALAHCLFNIPLAVWILEGFMSGVPKEIDETAYIDGYSFPRFFVKIFMPLIASGIGVVAFFCFMFSWVELLLAKTLTSVAAKPIAAVMTRTASISGYELGLLAAAGVLTIIPAPS